jgi:hypothetical protein
MPTDHLARAKTEFALAVNAGSDREMIDKRELSNAHSLLSIAEDVREIRKMLEKEVEGTSD